MNNPTGAPTSPGTQPSPTTLLDPLALPQMVVGRPRTWRLKDVWPSKKISKAIASRQAEEDFYLVRLVCSFPLNFSHTQHQIEEAMIVFELLPDNQGQQPVVPIAYDMVPAEVDQPISKKIRFTLSPMLKFQGFEVDPGTLLDYGIDYEQLNPIVVGSGVETSQVRWDYREAPGMPLAGIKWMNVLVSAPHGMPEGWARLYAFYKGQPRNVVFGPSGPEVYVPLDSPGYWTVKLW